MKNATLLWLIFSSESFSVCVFIAFHVAWLISNNSSACTFSCLCVCVYLRNSPFLFQFYQLNLLFTDNRDQNRENKKYTNAMHGNIWMFVSCLFSSQTNTHTYKHPTRTRCDLTKLKNSSHVMNWMNNKLWLGGFLYTGFKNILLMLSMQRAVRHTYPYTTAFRLSLAQK